MLVNCYFLKKFWGGYDKFVFLILLINFNLRIFRVFVRVNFMRIDIIFYC